MTRCAFANMEREPLDRTREQVRRVYLAAEQIGYSDDEIELMLCDCHTREEADALISRLARELIDVVRGLR
jgi:hypothetical protein